MNYDDDSTQSLLDQTENVATIDIEDSNAIARNKREPVKMNSLLQYFVVFAVLVTFVYAVQFAASDKLYFPSREKNTFLENHNKSNSPWTYECTKSQCVRRLLNKNELPITLETCNMMCELPSLWPKPKSVKIVNRTLSSFRKSYILTKIDAPHKVTEDLKQAIDIFMIMLPSTEKYWLEDVELTNVFINVKVTKTDDKIKIATDESYILKINKIDHYVEANITADTYFGARHGLETLSQLIIFDSKLQIYHDIEVKDKPAFAHRGLMVDTARNFIPIEQLFKVIDGMSMNKMNVFHLHLTDAVSFPVELPTNPWLAKYGAYSPEMTHRSEDIKDLVEYARIRGIRVILEIDAPSHVNEGWNHLNTDKEKTIICGDNDINNGHLNPDNKKVEKLLESVYKDLLEIGTDNETFHIGGDEVNLHCLAQTKASSKFDDIHEFWADYMNKIFKIVGQAFLDLPPKNLVIWSSDLTDRYLSLLKYPQNLVIQYWFGKLEPILQNGNKIIFSTVGRWYLDCGFGSWKPSGTNGACDPYTPWQTFYNYRPWANYHSNKKQVLGGEACLWTEQVGVDTLESRIWPRTAALAERLWSDLPKTIIEDVSTRLSDQRERLIVRGIKVATVWPMWCIQNPGRCN